MDRRLELQVVLESIFGEGKVFFVAPPSIDLQYPCALYELSKIQQVHADNTQYRAVRAYTVTVIDRNADSTLPAQVGALPLCSFNRYFTADGLHHTVFELFF